MEKKANDIAEIISMESQEEEATLGEEIQSEVEEIASRLEEMEFQWLSAVNTTAVTPLWQSTPAPAASNPRLGGYAAAHVPALAERRGYKAEVLDTSPGEEAV